MEGYLPPLHAAAWTAAAAPFVGYAGRHTLRLLRERPDCRLMLAAGTGFAFLLSALKLPSVAGSSSHPTGTGLGALLFGPAVMPLIGAIVLLFQALLLAHGGLTTLGANVFSMAVVGPWVAFAIWKLAGRAGLSASVAIFLAAALGDLSTYLTTALQLALAFPEAAGGTGGAFLTFAGIFAITQVPLAIVEGLLTASVFGLLRRQFPAELAAFQRTGA